MSTLAASTVQAKPFEKHLINSKRKGNKTKRGMGFVLMLTSMVDLFSVLVCFLLQTFSNSPEVIITTGLKLPNSTTSAMIREAPVLSLNRNGNVYVGQEVIGPLKELTKNPQPMLQKLEVLRRQWAKTNPTGEFLGQINLQADLDIPSTQVSKIMNILTAGQFSSIQLAVMAQK